MLFNIITDTCQIIGRTFRSNLKGALVDSIRFDLRSHFSHPLKIFVTNWWCERIKETESKFLFFFFFQRESLSVYKSNEFDKFTENYAFKDP